MIVETRPSEISDVASVRTLVVVEDQPEEKRAPPAHLGKLFYTSLFMSLLCFVLMLVDNIGTYPLQTIPTILAFVLLLPHHSASLVLLWLHRRHQSESITIKLPFTPYSPRVLAYAFFLIFMWTVSTGMCASDLYFSIRMHNSVCTYPQRQDIPFQPLCTLYRVPVSSYWTSIASTVASALETILITSIFILCYLHRRRDKKALTAPASPPPSSEPSPPEPQTKVISPC